MSSTAYAGATLNGTTPSPLPGGTFAGSIVSFTWAPAGAGASYSLWLGTTGAGSHNLRVSEKTTTNSIEVDDLPTDGGTIYLRLWTESAPGKFTYIDYTFKAAKDANGSMPL